MSGNLFERLADLIVRWRWPSVAISCAVIGTLSVIGLGIRIDFSLQDLFDQTDPEIGNLRAFRERYGADDDLLAVVLKGDDVFEPRVIRLIAEISEELTSWPGIRRVDSLTTVTDLRGEDGEIDTRPIYRELPQQAAPELKERALASELLSGQLVAKDGRLTVIAAKLRRGIERASQIRPIVDRVERFVEQLTLPTGVTLEIAGIPVVRRDVATRLGSEMLRLIPLAGLVNIVVLVILFRRWHGLIIPGASVLLSVGATLGIMVAAGEPLGILSNTLPILVMVYGMADAVHMLGRAHEELRGGHPLPHVIRLTMRYLGRACLLTSVTTAIGFGSLMVSGMQVLRSFGGYAALGVMIAYVVSLAAVPLGLHWSGLTARSIDKVPLWPRLDRALGRHGFWVGRHARSIFVLSLLVLAASGLIASKLSVNNYILSTVYHPTDPRLKITKQISREAQGVVSLQVLFRGERDVIKRPDVLRAMDRLERWIAAQPGVSSVISPATYLRELHRVVVGPATIPSTRQAVAQLLLMIEGETSLERLINGPYSEGRVHASSGDLGAKRFLALADRVDAKAKALAEGLPVAVTVTGTGRVAYRGINRLIRHLIVSLSVALVIIALILIVLFRSVAVGLISLIPNLMPLGVGLAYQVLTGMELTPDTAMVYSIALGIAVDDTIHFVARYREESAKGSDPFAAAAATLRSAGRAMIFTSVILISGFFVTTLSDFPTTYRFGKLAVLIFAAALVTDLVVTPACMVVLRPWYRPNKASAL